MLNEPVPIVTTGNVSRQMAADKNPITGQTTPRYALEIGGDLVGSGNPLHVAIPGGLPLVPAGSTGFDYSANGVTTPAGVLLLTIPVNDDRLAVEVQNQSAVDVTLVRDDGANGQRSAIVLATGGAVGAAGGGWSSITFRGRIRVYGPANSRVAAMED